MPDRTASGAPSAEARQEHAAGPGGAFPIFDERSARAAIDLRGHAHSPEVRAHIIEAAAKYIPEAAAKAREQDKE